MHELAICEALIGQVERVARERGARGVVSVTVAVGPLSGVEPQLLAHAYPLAAAGTVAEHAQLLLETVPVRVRCRKCKSESTVEVNRLLCSACNGWQVEVVAGEELLLQRVELEVANASVA